MQSSPSSVSSILVPVVIIAIVVVLRGRRMSAQRPLRLGTLWIMPVLFLAIAGFTLAEFPPRGVEWLWLAISLVLGVALGWQRGRLMKIWVEPDSGRIQMQGSGWAFAFLVVLIVLRALLRTGLNMEAEAGVISPALINNVFVIFALGLFGTQRGEMALRAMRLKKAHDDRAPGTADPSE